MIRNPAIRQQIIETMGTVLLQEQSLRNKINAAETLAKLGHEEAIPYLLAALDNAPDETFFAAINRCIQMIIEAQPEDPNPTAATYDLRGAQIGNLANTVQGDQIYNDASSPETAQDPQQQNPETQSKPSTHIEQHFHGPTYGVAGNVEGSQAINPPETSEPEQ